MLLTNIALTALILIALIITATFGMHRCPEGTDFMGRDYSKVIKGLCCIVIIMIHFPEAYTNPLQGAIGSFAYTAVTFFFLTSAYGMSISARRNPNYLKGFWRGRLVALLVPQFIINIGAWALLLTVGKQYNLLFVNMYVVILLEYCLVFWLMERFGKRISLQWRAVTLCAVVIASSMIEYWGSSHGTGWWSFERWGLVWGLILAVWFIPVRKLIFLTRWATCGLIVVTAIIGASYLKFKGIPFWGDYVLKVVLGLMIIWSLFAVTCRLRLGNKVAFWLGDISYEVYLSHGVIMQVLAALMPGLQSGYFILLTVSGTLLFSYIAHLIGHPMVNYLRAIKLRRVI